MYSDKVIDRFKKPIYVGAMEDADAVGEEGNVKCGDVMKIYLKVKNNVITDIKFQTYGCVAAIVSSDYMCQIAKGKTLEQAEKISSKDIMKEIGELPAIKHHCSVLGEEALHNAIANYRNKTKTKNIKKK